MPEPISTTDRIEAIFAAAAKAAATRRNRMPEPVTIRYTAHAEAAVTSTTIIGGVAHHRWQRRDSDTHNTAVGAHDNTVTTTDSTTTEPQGCLAGSWKVTATSDSADEARRICDGAADDLMIRHAVNVGFTTVCPACSDKETGRA